MINQHMNRRKSAAVLLFLIVILTANYIHTRSEITPDMPDLPTRIERWTNAYGGADKSHDTALLKLRHEIAPRFQVFTFDDSATGRTMTYNLFVPKDYDPAKRYPLVLFMADASTVGKGTIAPLMQGYGGIIWATDESQAEHPCIVLVPAYDGPEAATNDRYEVTDEVAVTYRLLRSVVSHYAVDTTRIYATGQSMGGMITFYLNVHYPDLFAASLYVGTHWNFDELKPVIPRQRFFYIASEADKAAPVMERMESFFQEDHIPYAATRFAANLPDAEKERLVQALIAEGRAINLVRFTQGSMLPPGSAPNSKGGDHMYSFDYAYRLQAVRNWLFAQQK